MEIIKDECSNCEKIKIIKYRVDECNGYVEFCSKKCAKEYIRINWDDLIYKYI